jgi:zinc transporter ZupT
MQIWWLILLFLLPFTGAWIGMRVRNERLKELKLFLAFSGAFLISITLLNLVPEVYSHLGAEAGYFVLGGFFLQIITDYFSKGIEHGHLHLHEFEKRFPISVFLALSFHALLEGVGIGGGAFKEDTMNNMVLAIGLHEMPAAFALAVILKSGKLRKQRSNFVWVLLYSLMVPMGLLIGDQLKLDEHLVHSIMAVVIGVFLHISTTILFENSESHKFSKIKLLAIGLGLVLALLTMNVHVH